MFAPIITTKKNSDRQKNIPNRNLWSKKKEGKRMIENRRAEFDSDYAKLLKEQMDADKKIGKLKV